MDERILGLLKDARRQLEAERQRRFEGLAVVGIGCRFPGAESPAELWRLLREGRDTTSQVPSDRWSLDALYDPDPEAPGKLYVKRGGFLRDIAAFDPEFFGISPREARAMDPQQRLVLEVVWEALEHAGIVPELLRGSATGVWLGSCIDDYARRSVLSGDLARIDGYSALGTTRSVTAGRVAYVLDLKGPAVQIDTSCSSSLVALHQACLSLRNRECDVALVGGVNVMSSPESTIALCKLRALAPDGRCKTFDASADGYARGEGCGIVVLERLSDAVANGRTIHAVIRGTATNHDGRSNGLTAPNGLAQEAVIRSALANAGLESADVDYVEAHGTGTLLGDPIEVLALSRVYGEGRSKEAPLRLGAVKTNLGHLEGAAGIAGLIKVVLCLSHSQIAPHLNCRLPNPKIPWSKLPVEIALEGIEWKRNGRARAAGVSSFGMSGTNAHVVLEEAPQSGTREPTKDRAAELFVLSGKSAEAVNEAARRMGEHVEQRAELRLGELAYSLATTRTLMEERLSMSAGTRAELLSKLEEASRGQTPRGGARGRPEATTGKLVWLFTGQGAQRAGMGRELYEQWEVFRTGLDEACAELDPHLERPLKEVMWAQEGSDAGKLLNQTAYTQPALFALGWALAKLLGSWGVKPDVVGGHSIGELTAACVAGVFTLSDAARLVSARGRLMQSLPAAGAMVSIAATKGEVEKELKAYAKTVSLAAHNGPTAVVVAGVERDVLALAERFQTRGVFTKRLSVSHAFHSPLMEPMLGEFRREAESVKYQAAQMSLLSNVSGALAGREVESAEYWVRHVREAVNFHDGVQALSEHGVTAYMELGPRGTLMALVGASLPEGKARLMPTLKTGGSEAREVLDALGEWLVAGGRVDWGGLFPEGSRRVELPTYPWQRQRYWLDATANRTVQQSSLEVEEVLRRLPSTGLLSRDSIAALPNILEALAVQRSSARDGDGMDAWSYGVSWRPIASFVPAAIEPGDWIVWAPAPGAEELASAFVRAGLECHVAPDLAALEALLRGPKPVRGVVCWPDAKECLRDTLLSFQLLQASEARVTRAWWLTSGAVGTSRADPPSDPDQALVWGLGRSYALEHPRAWAGLIDLPAGWLTREQADRVVGLLLGDHGEDQLALRGGGALVARLARIQFGSDKRWYPAQGAALITGGLGGVGLEVARWLVQKGVRDLTLVSRREPAGDVVSRRLAELREQGASVTVVAADVCDARAMATVVHDVARRGPLMAVFHAAGVNDRTPLAELTHEKLEKAIAAKREGTRILRQLTLDQPMSAFICFSSIAGVWGAGRQAAYAAGNAFLDAWAEQESVAGRRVTSVAWGPWAAAGMADEESRTQLSRRGLMAIAPALALKALDRVLGEGAPRAVIADVVWDKFRLGFEAWGPRKLLEDIDAVIPKAAASDAGTGAVLEMLEKLPPSARKDRFRLWLSEQCASVLGHEDASRLSMNRGFFDIGFDSLMVVELRRRLERQLGCRVSPTLAFSHPSINSLADYLFSQISPTTTHDSAAVVTPSEADAADMLESEQDVIRFIDARFETEE